MVDLHTHSTRSDGSYTPEELIDYALEKGLSAIALTDHDTVDGLQDFLTYGKTKPIEVIPGIELSAEYEGKDVHIVGLFIDEKAPIFKEHLHSFIASRTERNYKMCAKLQQAGIDITYEKLVEEFPGCTITRAHYARFLLNHGYVACLPDAFDKYLGDHTPFFVPREKVSPEEAIGLIKEAGGIAIFAHPILCRMSKERLDKLVCHLKENGLDGIEAYYTTYTKGEENQILVLAHKYDLLVSGGSDFHGKAKPRTDLGVGFGNLSIQDSVYYRLKEYAQAFK